jgi:D-sedoheptulose 7-phosphate isomerase
VDVLGIMEQKIFSHFQKMIETTMVVGDLFSESIASAAESISSTLLAGGTIFSCGDKSGILAAELLTNYLTSGFEIERPGFPALNINQLCATSPNRSQLSNLLNIHAQSSDLLVVTSAGGNAPQLMAAVEAAIERGMAVVLLSGKNDDKLVGTIGYNDVQISTSEISGQLAVLAQIEIIQCLSALIDDKILGGM